MENKRKHLELIQGVVNRLSTNSFLLKGWSVVLVSALFALATPDHNPDFVYLAYLPVIVLWGLDGYFLWQERLYRDLYDQVRLLDETEIDFSMNTTPLKGNKGRTWPESVLSRTLLAFHGVLIPSVIIVMMLLLREGA